MRQIWHFELQEEEEGAVDAAAAVIHIITKHDGRKLSGLGTHTVK